MTTAYSDTNHLLIWDKSGSRTDDQLRFAYLGNLLLSPSMWNLDNKKPITRNFVSGTTRRGLPSADLFFVSGFVVLKGSTTQAIDLAQALDFSFLCRFTLDTASAQQVEAYSTLSFIPVSGASASVALLWSKVEDPSLKPAIATEVVIETINEYNIWTRSLKAQGHHLDSARLNVRFETYHVEGGTVSDGRVTTGRLAAIGTYPKYGMTAEEAFERSGLDAGRYVVDVARGNGWWSALSDVPEFYDHPLNAILY